LVCPYCFAETTRRRLRFRCAGSGAGRTGGCAPELDSVYAEHMGSAAGAVLPPVFDADGRKPRAVHAVCNQLSLRRVCPGCHSDLPGDYCDVDSRLVALVGAKNSGKSTFIGVLVHELMNRVGQELGAALNACDDRTSRRYRDDFERLLYQDRSVPETTQSAAAGLRAPLVYRLTVRRRRWLLRRGVSLTLVLFDTAGEDLTSEGSTDRHLRYLGVADAIVFLVDPLELPGAAADLRPAAHAMSPPGQPPGQPPDDPLDVIRRVTTLLRARLARPAPKRLPIAVAVALTKIDAFDAALMSNSPLHRDRRRDGRLDLADRGLVQEQVRALLDRWGEGSLDRELAESYRVYGLFGLSALGRMPRGRDIDPAGISPHRVEDPLLWLLHRFHMISASGG
jgi:hypothetical protein